MIYVEKIKIVDKTYPGNIFKKGSEIDFSDVNLFVGNQGCGKSTLLQLLKNNHKDIQLTLSKETLKNGVSTFYFDTEKDNPRVKDLNHYTTPDGRSKGIGMGAALATHFNSHGEVLEAFVIKPLLDAKDCVIILDEPESGLSITNQFKLIYAINKAVENNCQLFIATHCYPLIEKFDVISLQHNKKMSGSEFIKKVSKF